MTEYDHRKNVSNETTTSAEQFDQATFFKEHLQRTDDGKLTIVGDDLSPVEVALLETEKRRRGSQSAVTREKLRADRYELELNKVKEEIPKVQVEEPIIDPALKYSDPDEYIRLTLEAKQKDPYAEVFDTASQYAQQTVGEQTVQSVLIEHNQTHPDKPLTEEMLNMDLPPRLLNDMSEGKLSPQEFLAKAADILYRPKAVVNPDIPETPNLGDVPGSTTPTGQDSTSDEVSYESAIF